jgi:hypothetical protein
VYSTTTCSPALGWPRDLHTTFNERLDVECCGGGRIRKARGNVVVVVVLLLLLVAGGWLGGWMGVGRRVR